MCKNIPLKKKIFFAFFIIAVLAIGGFFYFYFNNREIKGSPNDYVIKETSEGRFVENEKAGLTAKIPEGWIEKKINYLEGSIVFYLSETQGEIRNGIISPPLSKGCAIETSLIYKKTTFEKLKEEIKSIHWGLNMKYDNFEEIVIRNYPSLKNSYESTILGQATSVYILTTKKVYDFDLYSAPNEKENCEQEFDKFLQTVSIQ